MRRLLLLSSLLLLIETPVLAQTLTTDAPAPQKAWEILLKLAFPVLMTVIGPYATYPIRGAPTPVKYAVASLASMLIGAGLGSIPEFPLGLESAATIGMTSGATGQALYLSRPTHS
jgi:hypothetical protein